MPSERTYYVICEDNCKFEGMTKEQIIAAIAEATGATPTQIDDAFITKIKEMNANASLKFWVGTTAQFNALATKAADTLYIFTDDDTEESIEADIESLRTTVESFGASITAMQTAVNNLIDGTTHAGVANYLSGGIVFYPPEGVTESVDKVSIIGTGLYAVWLDNNNVVGGYHEAMIPVFDSDIGSAIEVRSLWDDNTSKNKQLILQCRKDVGATLPYLSAFVANGDTITTVNIRKVIKIMDF